jgi:hypothetical protein
MIALRKKLYLVSFKLSYEQGGLSIDWPKIN